MKAVVFDMDGLMFDTEMIFSLAWDYAGEKIGIGKVGYMNKRLLGLKDAYDETIWKLEVGEKFNAAEMKKYSKEFINHYYQNNKVPVKKGLYNLLDYLKLNNYKLAVASSSSMKSVLHHLRDANIYDYFYIVVSGDMVEKSKPFPNIYLKACDLLAVNPSDCYALEDSKNGLLSAYRAGLKPIMVPDLIQPDGELLKIVHHVFEDLDQVLEYLKIKKE